MSEYDRQKTTKTYEDRGGLTLGLKPFLYKYIIEFLCQRESHVLFHEIGNARCCIKKLSIKFTNLWSHYSGILALTQFPATPDWHSPTLQFLVLWNSPLWHPDISLRALYFHLLKCTAVPAGHRPDCSTTPYIILPWPELWGACKFGQFMRHFVILRGYFSPHAHTIHTNPYYCPPWSTMPKRFPRQFDYLTLLLYFQYFIYFFFC